MGVIEVGIKGLLEFKQKVLFQSKQQAVDGLKRQRLIVHVFNFNQRKTAGMVQTKQGFVLFPDRLGGRQ